MQREPPAPAEPSSPTAARYHSLLLGFVATMFVLSFTAVASEVLEGDTHPIDVALARAAHALRTGHPWLADAMRDLSGLGSTVVLTLVVALTAGYLLVVGLRTTAAMVAAASLAGAFAVGAMKALFGRARPDDRLAEFIASGLSFPSGHATMSAAVYLTVGALVAGTRASWRERLYILAAAAALAAATGLSRVALGVHWASDVVAGWAFGAGWAALWLLVAQRLAARRTAPPSR
jgi:undecaprenyl-diphosphatase